MAHTETPLMRQYKEIKQKVPDALLFFRLGDFYELFLDDAIVASKILQIALTSRNKNDPNPIAMCGVPFHSATNYINKLIAQGHKVAICEQMEAPTAGKGIVRRDIVRVISPGTQLDPNALNSKANNYTHAAILLPKGEVSWATCDYSTGEFVFGQEPNLAQWLATARSQDPSEVIFADTESGESLYLQWKAAEPKKFAQTVPRFYFEDEYAEDRIAEQFETKNLKAIHPQLVDSKRSVGALIKYFQETQKFKKIPTVTKLTRWNQDQCMELDPATIRSLELLPSNQNLNTGRDLSLLQHLDQTKTAMGARLLRRWLLRPLTDIDTIQWRLDSVEELHDHFVPLQKELQEIYDLERLIGRIALKTIANARDLQALSHSLRSGQKIAKQSMALKNLRRLFENRFPAPLMQKANEVLNALKEELPLSVREGGLFQRGFHSELDELIELTENGEKWLTEFELKERQATKISSLKVKFNKVFGYYIEITKTHLKSVPLHYVRKQTMVNGERYITEELKRFEEKILTSEKKRNDLEFALYQKFCEDFAEFSTEVAQASNALSTLDALCAFAMLSSTRHYTRPELNTSRALSIEQGAHPTVAAELTRNSSGIRFIPNDTALTETQPFLLITGPNMGGKSTVMRQTALITLMAQIGCFVPADKASLGIVDRIFTRIGANDNIAEGASTFMVEMSEMSFILRNATNRSLVLIDEIGRGTSTYDGLSLAWALAEHLALKTNARTLFSTHYHELTALAQTHACMQNARMAVRVHTNTDGHASVDFLYRLEPGAAERSYGILVARLAGLPDSVLHQAKTVLETLETGRQNSSIHAGPLPTADPSQLALGFQAPQRPETKKEPKPSPAEQWLQKLDVNKLTPLEALLELSHWVDRVKDSNYNSNDGSHTEQDVHPTS